MSERLGEDVQESLFTHALDKLVPWAERESEKYRNAEPFPHIVKDDFLPQGLALRILREFPSPDFEGFQQPDNRWQVNKLGRIQESKLRGISPFLRNCLNDFNSMAFINFLEILTKIQGIVPDPHMEGGALHQILPGGKLAIHADFNRNLRLKLERRINVLVYFNENWKKEYGGELELWNKKMTKCVQIIAPIFNRVVIFNTTSTSFHGHPEPLRCPEGMTRKSIAFYYYTVGRDDGEPTEFHQTLWQARPGEVFPPEEFQG